MKAPNKAKGPIQSSGPFWHFTPRKTTWADGQTVARSVPIRSQGFGGAYFQWLSHLTKSLIAKHKNAF